MQCGKSIDASSQYLSRFFPSVVAGCKTRTRIPIAQGYRAGDYNGNTITVQSDVIMCASANAR